LSIALVEKYGCKIRHSPTNKQPYYKKDFFAKNHIFLSSIELFCTFARSKQRKSSNNNIKLIKNEEISSYIRIGCPLHGGLQQHP